MIYGITSSILYFWDVYITYVTLSYLKNKGYENYKKAEVGILPSFLLKYYDISILWVLLLLVPLFYYLSSKTMIILQCIILINNVIVYSKYLKRNKNDNSN